jgi:hypothetical protein
LYISFLSRTQETNTPNFLNLFQASGDLNINIKQVRELCKYGYLPGAYRAYKNGPWKIPPEAIEQWKSRRTDPTRIPTIWDRIRYHLTSNWIRTSIATFITVLGLLFGLISAGADIGGARQQLVEWGIFRAFPIASDNEILIVIATFHRTEGVVDTDVHNEIRRAIYSG